MNGLQTLNWVLYIAFLCCIWGMPIGQYLITMLIVIGYGVTERWIGQGKNL
jgi:hypothetical protein